VLAGLVAVASPAAAQPARGRAADDKTQPVTVDADKMERFGKESLVVFTGNVVARQNNSVHYADRMEIYLDEKGDRIVRTVSTGTVKVVTRDCRTGTARRAEYHDVEQRVEEGRGARHPDGRRALPELTDGRSRRAGPREVVQAAEGRGRCLPRHPAR
jgi:lipopolysaccharide export system protein LptA